MSRCRTSSAQRPTHDGSRESRLLEALAEHVVVVDAEGRVESCRRLERGDCAGAPCTLVAPAVRDAAIAAVLRGEAESAQFEFPCAANGQQFLGTVTRRAGGGAVVTYVDITRQQLLAHHDELTGLLNRRAFVEHLQFALARCQRARMQLGVLYLDLDQFKLVNDRLGHAVGDELLQEVGRRLAAALRTSDAAARLGGDEFAVAVEGLAGAPALATVRRKLANCLAPLVRVGQRPIRVRVSIGAALFPRDGRTAEAVLRAADASMYAEKRARAALRAPAAED